MTTPTPPPVDYTLATARQALAQADPATFYAAARHFDAVVGRLRKTVDEMRVWLYRLDEAWTSPNADSFHQAARRTLAEIDRVLVALTTPGDSASLWQLGEVLADAMRQLNTIAGQQDQAKQALETDPVAAADPLSRAQFGLRQQADDQLATEVMIRLATTYQVISNRLPALEPTPGGTVLTSLMMPSLLGQLGQQTFVDAGTEGRQYSAGRARSVKGDNSFISQTGVLGMDVTATPGVTNEIQSNSSNQQLVLGKSEATHSASQHPYSVDQLGYFGVLGVANSENEATSTSESEKTEFVETASMTEHGASNLALGTPAGQPSTVQSGTQMVAKTAMSVPANLVTLSQNVPVTQSVTDPQVLASSADQTSPANHAGSVISTARSHANQGLPAVPTTTVQASLLNAPVTAAPEERLLPPVRQPGANSGVLPANPAAPPMMPPVATRPSAENRERFRTTHQLAEEYTWHTYERLDTLGR